ncbi:MAG TPA: DUF5009 domain-containing protein [Tepidisphaeraceae bacterium]|jgi:predicted acyltransferase
MTITSQDVPAPAGTTSLSPLPASARLLSLDVFRGLTIAFMVLVNSMPDPKYDPFEHANWDGWTLTDLVFPFFLFIVGVAVPFSFAKRLSDPNASRKSLLAHVWLRALILFMLGWMIHSMPGTTREMPEQGFYSLKILGWITRICTYGGLVALLIPWKWKRAQIWVPVGIAVGFILLIVINHFTLAHAQPWLPEKFRWGGGALNPDRIRIPGVLQRIGICYGIAATIALYFNWRMVLLSAILLLAGYSALMLRAPFPNHVTGSLTKNDNLERKIDETVLDRFTLDETGKRHYTQRHTYGEYPDPEGILSTVPSVSTVLIGILVGLWLRTPRPTVDRCAAILVFGFVVAALGAGMGWWVMPVNKKIWSPSFVVLTAGLGMLTLGAMFWVIDIKGWRTWSLPLAILGMNAIFLYALSELLDYFMGFVHLGSLGGKNPLEWLGDFYNGLEIAKQNASLLYALSYVAIIFIAAAILYVFKIFIRI